MKIPRFLKWCMALFVCIALIRAVNDAGEFSLMEFFERLSRFDFDFSEVKKMILFFKDGSFRDTFVSWDSSLTGLDGFFINIKNVVMSFFATIGSVLAVVIRGTWNIIVQFFRIIAELFSLFLSVLGYA